MWRQIRDPDFLLGALKTYRMMTGLSQMDPDFAADWWVNRLPEFAETPPFPTDAALAHQLAAIDAHGAATRATSPPDEALVAAALQQRLLDPARRAAPTTRCCSDPAAAELPGLGAGQLRRPERRQGPHPPLGQDPARRHPRRLHLRRLPRRRARAARGGRRPGGARPLGLRRRLPRERRRLGRARSPRTCSSSTTRTSSPSGTRFLRDIVLAPMTDLRDREREPQGPLQRRFGAEAPADRRGRRDRPRPPGRGTAARRRAAQGRLEDPRQARQARQARQEGREVHPRRRRRRGRHLRPAGLGPLQADQGGDRRGRRRAAGARRRGDRADRALERAADRRRQPQPRGRDQGTRAASPS